jgi:hypothetical protein
MAWTISDTVAFVTLIIAIPTSIAGVWTLYLHLQARRAPQGRHHRLSDAISDGTVSLYFLSFLCFYSRSLIANTLSLLSTDTSIEPGIPLLPQSDPPSPIPPALNQTPTPTSTIPTLHLNPTLLSRPAFSPSTTPPNNPEAQTGTNSMQYDYFICMLTNYRSRTTKLI